MNGLVAPIPGEDPFGLFLKGEKTIYRALRTAFNVAQASWRSLSETPESLGDRERQSSNSAAWSALSELCEACLKETSKDLEVLCWFVASQLHTSKPIENCRDALTLLVELVAADLDKLHPKPPIEKLRGDTEDARASEVAELRLRSFVQLFGEVEGSGLFIGPMTNLNLIGEVTFAKIALSEKTGSLDDIRSEVSTNLASEAEALTVKIDALHEMDKLIHKLETIIKGYAFECGQTPPLIGYGNRIVRDVLLSIEKLVKGLAFKWPSQGADQDYVDTVEDAKAEVDQSALTNSSVNHANVVATGFKTDANVSNRHDAFLAIAQLAQYFRKTEPHSPICLLLDRAVRWGNLSAAELYKEILSEGTVGMSQMALMTGLESQGFSDSFGRNRDATSGHIEHPQLNDYAAAVPVPSTTDQMIKPKGQSLKVEILKTDEPVDAVEHVMGEVMPKEEQAEETGEQNLTVESFEW